MWLALHSAALLTAVISHSRLNNQKYNDTDLNTASCRETIETTGALIWAAANTQLADCLAFIIQCSVLSANHHLAS